MPYTSEDFYRKYGGRGGGDRTAEEYGLYDLDDATLELLASNPNKYGEKSALAKKILNENRGMSREADMYRAALEKAAYSDAGRQYGQGIGQITNYLAKSGPLADSGAGTALRYKLASQIYGGIPGQVGGRYADYLRQLYQGRRQNRYQMELLKYQNKQNKTGFGGFAGGLAGGIGGFLAGGPAGAAAGYNVGSQAFG